MTVQDDHKDGDVQLQADLLVRLWKQARRPHVILRAGLVERGLDRPFDDLNKSIRDARVQLTRPEVRNSFDRHLPQRFEREKERLVEETADLIRSAIDGGLYIVLIKTEVGLTLLDPERRRIAVFGYDQDWVRVGDKVLHDVRLAPAWLASASEVRLLAGVVSARGLKEARKKIDRAGLLRFRRSGTSSGWKPNAANDDFLVPPSRQAKRKPPDYDALLETSDRRRGPKCKWVEHLALMEERAGQGRLEATLAAEVRTLIRIGLARNFTHRPHLKTLQNALGRHYKKFRLKKSS